MRLLDAGCGSWREAWEALNDQSRISYLVTSNHVGSRFCLFGSVVLSEFVRKFFLNFWKIL